MRIITIIFILSVFASCQRAEDVGGLETTIVLTVLDDFTGSPIPDQRINLVECSTGTLIFNNCSTEEELFSDNFGRADFEFTNEANKEYSLEYEPLEPFEELAYMSPVAHRVREGETNIITFRLKPTIQVGIRFIHNGSGGFSNLSCVANRNIESDLGISDWRGFQVALNNLSQAVDTIIYGVAMQDEIYELETTLQRDNFATETISLDLDTPREDTVIVKVEF